MTEASAENTVRTEEVGENDGPLPDGNKQKKNVRPSPRRRAQSKQFSWRNPEKENQTPKSRGLAPSNFYSGNQSGSNAAMSQKIKIEIEQNLFIQEKEEHRRELEERRKVFRQMTNLQRWPLQNMAIDHLNHLLGGNSGSQFHGGEYMTGDSSSSLDSTDDRKRQKSPGKKRQERYTQELETLSSEPLWSTEARIFATEKAQGKRKYLVGHFGRVADWYWRKSDAKHLYEVIREETPCRMYFDLEYSNVYNPDVDHKSLLEEFRLELAADLKKYYDITLKLSDIIDLDSSSDVKFSRHWILDLKVGLFEDAPTVGRFIKRLVCRLAEDQATGVLKEKRPVLAEHLFVKTKEPGKLSCFIDLGVYTRNRLFRCLASSKFGKTATLQISDTNEYPISLPPKQPPSPKESLEEYKQANDWTLHARALADTLVIPLGGSEGLMIFQVPKDEGIIGLRPGATQGSAQRTHKRIIPIRSSTTPFPTLDNFVSEQLASRGGVQGTIRAWSIERGTRDAAVSITYQVDRNRFCELIGRPHKSNHIFWTVEFASWTCLQGCWDPECYGRGAPISIPNDRLKNIKEEFEQWQEEEFEKALSALNLDDLQSHSNTQLGASDSDSDKFVVGSHDDDVQAVDKTVVDDVKEKPITGHAEGEAQDDDEFATSLSDAELQAAMEANPELFP